MPTHRSRRTVFTRAADGNLEHVRTVLDHIHADLAKVAALARAAADALSELPYLPLPEGAPVRRLDALVSITAELAAQALAEADAEASELDGR